jgi:hypothetical protein
MRAGSRASRGIGLGFWKLSRSELCGRRRLQGGVRVRSDPHEVSDVCPRSHSVALSGDSRDPRSVPGTAAASAPARTAHRSAHSGRRPDTTIDSRRKPTIISSTEVLTEQSTLGTVPYRSRRHAPEPGCWVTSPGFPRSLPGTVNGVQVGPVSAFDLRMRFPRSTGKDSAPYESTTSYRTSYGSSRSRTPADRLSGIWPFRGASLRSTGTPKRVDTPHSARHSGTGTSQDVSRQRGAGC